MSTVLIPGRWLSEGSVLFGFNMEPTWTTPEEKLLRPVQESHPLPLELVKFKAVEDLIFYTHGGPLQQKSIALRDLGEGLILQESISVSVEVWNSFVTAYCYDLDEFEVAADEFSAVEELRRSIADLYRVLKSDQERLGPLPQRWWDYLRRIIREA